MNEIVLPATDSARPSDRLPEPNARTALGVAMIEAHLPNHLLERLRGGGAFGLIIEAPSHELANIICEGLDEVLDGEQANVVQIERRQNWLVAETLVRSLADGHAVVAVCAQAEQVPASFGALADVRMRVPSYDARVLRRAMRRMLSGTIPAFPKGFVPHPNADLVCRCMSARLSPRRVVQALVRLSDTAKQKDVEALPDLEQAIEFGPARNWGLQVKRDLAAWRAGDLPASELDTACLLSGASGVGKTLFAKVLARSLDVPLHHLTMGDTYEGEGHLGDVLREIRARFEAASAAAPAVLLIDEMDSVLSRDADPRNAAFVTGVINDLLSLLDGSTRRHPGLIIVGTTNRPEAIDPALLRPGRMGRHIRLLPPDSRGVENILRFHLGKDLRRKSLEAAVRLATGMTPAELMDLVRTARRHARNEDRRVTELDLVRAAGREEAIDWMLLPRVAVHECGHALACMVIPEASVLHSVSIRAAGGTEGRVMSSEPPGAITRRRMEARVMVNLAGRAAEQLIYGDDPSEGSAQDLYVATHLVARMHAQLGMHGSLAHYGDLDAMLVHDKTFAALVERDLQRLMQETISVLRGFQDHLIALASKLCSRRILTAAEVLETLQAFEAASDGVGSPPQSRGVAA